MLLGSPAAAISELCGVFYVEPERGIYVPIQGYSIMAATPPLTAPPNQPRIDAIVCERPGLSISPNDYRVLTDLHVPLFIRAGERTVAMELDQGGVRLRFTNGAPLPEEMQGLRDALDRANDDLAHMSAPG